MRHHWNPSQVAILKRGFILTLALFLFVAVFKPVKVNAQEGVECRVSYINFTTDRETSDSGTLLHNSNQWVIIDFNLNGYYSGTIDYTVTLTTSALIPEVTCVGAYYEVTTTRSSSDSGTIYSQTDTYTFTLSNCQHFQLIYHASTSGAGVYMGGSHSLTDSDLIAVDGSGSGSAAVDYTAILNGIAYDITEIYMYMDQIAQDSAGIADTVALIYNNTNSINTLLDSVNDGIIDLKTLFQTLFNENLKYSRIESLPYYSKLLYYILTYTGFTINTSTSNPINGYNYWSLASPSSYTRKYCVYLVEGTSYTMVFYSNNNNAITMTLTKSSNTSTTIEIEFDNMTATGYRLCYKDFTPESTGWYHISDFVQGTITTSYLYPLYFGYTDSVPTEIQELTGGTSLYNLIKHIRDLFIENNQQNDEMIGKLDTITDNQETINQSINDFNNDFNDAMSDIPISETTSQLQQMQSTFTYTNDLISQLWNALGRIQLVIIVALIIALIQIFRGKKT